MERSLRIARAAAAYWGVVFAFAFVTGAVRTLWLVPAIGALPAVLCELPLVLGVSWWAARRIVRRRAVRPGGEALAMGLIAFALLMLAEAALARVLSGLSLSAWLRGMGNMAGAVGLFGQLVFALLPWLVRRGRMR